MKRIWRTGFMLAGFLLMLLSANLWGNQVPVIRVAAFNYYPAIFLDSDNQVRGFYVDMLDEIAAREQIRFEYVFGSWNDGLERLRAGDVDLVTSAAYTEERATFMDYGQQALLTVWGELYLPQDSPIVPIKDLQDKRIAVMRGDHNARTIEEHLARFGVNSQFIEYADFDEVFGAIKDQHISAGVVNSIFGDAAAKKYQLQASGIAFNPFDIYFATAKGQHAEMLSLLDDYLNAWRNDSTSVYFQSRLAWGATQDPETVIPDWVIKLAAVAAVLLLLGLFFIVLLRYQVHRTTHQLKKREVELLKSSDMIRLLLDSTAEAIYGLNPQGICTFCNAACVRILGYDNADQLIGRNMHDLIQASHADGTVIPANECELLKDMDRQYHCANKMFCRVDGSSFPVEYWSYPIQQDDQNLGLVVSFVDITERKQMENTLRLQAQRAEALLELPRLADEYDEKIFMQRAQEMAEDLTDSKIAFIHFINDGGNEIKRAAWSRRTLEHYCTAAYDSHYPMSKAGIWADALREGKPVIFNDYPNYAHKKGLPEGHSMLQRFISVPVIENGQVVMLAGVGNKDSDYSDCDSESVQLIASGIWQIVKKNRTAKAYQEAMAKFERLARHVPGVLYQFQLRPDGSFCFPYASRGIQNIWGVLPEQVVDDGEAVFKAIHPDDHAQVNESIQESARTLSDWRDQCRVNLPDGRTIWVGGESTPEAQPDGSILWHGYLTDITEQKMTEEALRESEERFKALHNASFGGIAIHDQGAILDCNQGLSKISGFGQDELIGMDALLLIAEKSRETVRNNLRSGYDKHYEVFGLRKNGQEYPLRLDAKNIPYQGKMVRVVEFRDITERKRAQMVLQQKNEEMEQFVNIVSHDLKSPLVTVKTFTGMLRMDLQGGDQQQINNALNYIDQAADKMQQLLDALLRYSRIGRIDTPAQTVSADQQVQNCLTTLAGILQQHQVQVSTGRLPQQLHGDPLHFGQIWQNLIENAVKYRGDQAQPHIEIGATQEGQDVVFYVRDNGMGIEPKHSERIFNLFSQLQPGSDGSGLGLALVKKIVTIYHGRIWVESEGAGRGSCFRFTLPVAIKTRVSQ